MKKEFRKDFKELEKAFNNLDYIFQGINSGMYFKNYHAINIKEEKMHLSGKPKNVTHALSISQGAKYFSVKYIIECFYISNKFTIKDILHVRQSCIYAQSLFENYTDEIIKAFENVDIEKIKALDYAELVKE